MSEDRFRYVEQEPPLRGEERKRDYNRQYSQWRYHTKPGGSEYVKATTRWHAQNNPVYQLRHKLAQMERTRSGEHAEYQRRRAAEKRARQLAVAREYGASL